MRRAAARLGCAGCPAQVFAQPYPDGRFWHVIPADADVLLVQTSGGRRLLLDAATGRVLHDDPTATEPWPRDPVRSPGGVYVTTDARNVVLLDPASGRDVWTYTLPGVTTRTGAAAAGRLRAERPARGVGHEHWLALQRLDPATGNPIWDESPLLNVAAVDVDGWSQDADAFYGVQDRVLFARSLKSGLVLWQQPLAGPPGHWRTRRIGDVLFAYPIETCGARFQFRWLFGALQWEGRLALEEESGRGFPVLCFDPKMGRLVQRINLAIVPLSSARLDPEMADVLPAVKARLLDDVNAGPLLDLSTSGLVVGLSGRAWGLSAAK